MLKMQTMDGKKIILKSLPGTHERNVELFGVLSGIANSEALRKELMESMPDQVICGTLLAVAQNWPGKPTEDWLRVISMAAYFIHKTVGLDTYIKAVLADDDSQDSKSQKNGFDGSPTVGTA